VIIPIAYANGNPISLIDPLGLWDRANRSWNQCNYWPFTAAFSAGIAFDGMGNVAGYTEMGAEVAWR